MASTRIGTELILVKQDVFYCSISRFQSNPFAPGASPKIKTSAINVLGKVLSKAFARLRTSAASKLDVSASQCVIVHCKRILAKMPVM